MATDVTTMAVRSQGNAGLRRFGLLVQANLLMYVRERAALFWVVIFPIGMMLLFGAMFGHIKVGPPGHEVTLISFMVPGLIVLALMSNGIVGNAEAMAVYRERGILRRIQTTPMPLWQLLFARIVTQSIVMVGQAFLMLGISIAVFNAMYGTWGVVQAIPAIILGAVVFMAMGQAIASVVRKATTVGLAAQAINLPLMFLGGLWMPLNQLPESLQTIGKFLPSALMADLLRAPMLASYPIESTNLPLLTSLIGVLIYFAISIVISIRFFKWS